MRGTLGHPFSQHVFINIMTSERVTERGGGKQCGRVALWMTRRGGALVTGSPEARSYPKVLLSGLATCGFCGQTPASRPRGDGEPAYVCASHLGGCRNIRVLAGDFRTGPDREC